MESKFSLMYWQITQNNANGWCSIAVGFNVLIIICSYKSCVCWLFTIYQVIDKPKHQKRECWLYEPFISIDEPCFTRIKRSYKHLLSSCATHTGFTSHPCAFCCIVLLRGRGVIKSTVDWLWFVEHYLIYVEHFWFFFFFFTFLRKKWPSWILQKHT